MKLTDQEKQDLTEFEQEVNFWFTALSLTDWDYRVSLKHDTDNANSLLNIPGRKAYIILCRNREKCIPIKQLAIHEALETATGDIHFALTRYYSDEYVLNLTHALINRLMPILMEFKK